jgi:hypothetical protein
MVNHSPSSAACPSSCRLKEAQEKSFSLIAASEGCQDSETKNNERDLEQMI